MRALSLAIILAFPLFLGAACTPGRSNLAASDGGVWVSASDGEAWEQRSTIYKDRVSEKTISEVNIARFVFSPADPRKLFAISEKSGLWFSWNQGHFWDLVLPNTGVADIAIHPENPSRIYAAVGATVALSTDEGVTWKSVYTSDNPGILITSVALRPGRTATVYAATSIGDLLVSDDSGISWRVHASLGTGTTLTRMQFHPQRDQTMYALVSGRGLARSEDAGEHWSYFEEEFKPFAGANDPRGYALVPSGIVYASRYGLLRSLNHGEDWTSLPLISGPRDANIYSVAVNQENPLEIFYGTTSTLYHSLDGGFNWIPRPLPTTRTATELALYPGNSDMLFMGAGLSRR
ncbi:MAG: hypothetical protein HYT31_02610 [Parcubacteria group bacterium]|nr:hypothetical protein [Parcubacteria group bacterium]